MNENDCCLCKDGRDTIPSLLLQDNRNATPIPRTIFMFPREFESVFPENAFISILRIFTAHLDVLNLLQSLTQGPPSFPRLSGSRRYLF